MLNNDILYYAVENLKRWVQLPVLLMESKNEEANAVLKIGTATTYSVEVKKAIHKTNLPGILMRMARGVHGFRLLVAKSISASSKEILKKENINYLDAAGNCFIKNEEGLYIEIEGKKVDGFGGKLKYTSLNKNGIKLLYALLLNEDLVNQSYSVMANAANISKSTIGGILTDLKNKNHLIQINEKTRRLDNRSELLERWVQAYNEKLKPSLFRGQFSFLPGKVNKWKKMKLGKETFWGGEPAGDLLTNYLSPGAWTIYSNNSNHELLKQLHLVPDPKEGNVRLYRIFWNGEEAEFVDENLKIVNPLLVYADLVGTSDNRNFETAKRIYEQSLSSYFVE